MLRDCKAVATAALLTAYAVYISPRMPKEHEISRALDRKMSMLVRNESCFLFSIEPLSLQPSIWALRARIIS
jgi:hypothetical protein